MQGGNASIKERDLGTNDNVRTMDFLSLKKQKQFWHPAVCYFGRMSSHIVSALSFSNTDASLQRLLPNDWQLRSPALRGAWRGPQPLSFPAPQISIFFFPDIQEQRSKDLEKWMKNTTLSCWAPGWRWERIKRRGLRRGKDLQPVTDAASAWQFGFELTGPNQQG